MALNFIKKISVSCACLLILLVFGGYRKGNKVPQTPAQVQQLPVLPEGFQQDLRKAAIFIGSNAGN